MRLLMCAISLSLLLSGGLNAAFDKAKVTVKLTDKSEAPLKNMKFDIVNSENEVVQKANTDDEGVYQTKLLKGESYLILLNKDGNEWKFSLDIPNKPGPRSYRFSYKVYMQSGTQVYYEKKKKGDEKSSKYCDVTIKIKDETGMPLPRQPFEIIGKGGIFRKEAKTDSLGVYETKLEKGEKYELVCEIDGYNFYSNFKISLMANVYSFDFDINFEKIEREIVDTAYTASVEAGKYPLTLVIRVVNPEGVPQDKCKVIVEESNKKVFSGMTEEAGEISTKAKRNRVYEAFVRKFGKTFRYEITPPKDTSASEFVYVAEVDFDFKPLRKFNLNAYFDTGRWDLREESFPALNLLAKNMKENPKMVIEIGGHTDDVGGYKSNQRLSEKRARSVKKYLIKKGISGERLFYKGYGEMRPVATNKTPQGRQLNRRIEVTVLAE